MDLPEGGAQAAYSAITLQDDVLDLDEEMFELDAELYV